MSLKKIEDALQLLGFTADEVLGFDLSKEEGYCHVQLKLSPIGIDILDSNKVEVKTEAITPFEQFCKDHPEGVSNLIKAECFTMGLTKFMFKTNLSGDPNRDIFKSSNRKSACLFIPKEYDHLVKGYDCRVLHDGKDSVFLPIKLASYSKVYLNEVLLDTKDYYIIDELVDETKDVLVEKVNIRPMLSTNGVGKDHVNAIATEIYISSESYKNDPWCVKVRTDEGETKIVNQDGLVYAPMPLEKEESKPRWKTPTPRTAMRYIYFHKESEAKKFAKDYEKDFEYAASQTLGSDSIQPYKIRKNHSDNDLYAQGYMWSLEFRMNGRAFQDLEKYENLKKKESGNKPGHCVRYKES